jgi:hypothetical protein
MSSPEVSLDVMARTMARLGWQPAGTFRDSVEYWELAADRGIQGAPEEIIVPRDPSTVDFRSLLARAQQTLDSLYGAQARSIALMIEAMITHDLNELLLRRDTPDVSGLIDWIGGNEMVESARGFLVASAKATSKPRRRFANADTTIAEEYLAACRMGQTQVGSYVVTALTPSHGSFATSRSTKSDAKKGPIFQGRDITDTLIRALEASKEAIHESRTGAQPEILETYVPHGVSLELVRALRQLVSEHVESSVSVEVQHEPTLIEQAATTVHEFVFSPDDAPVLDQAAQYFEESPAPRAVSLSGEVVLLKNSARAAEHQIKLSSRVNGAPRMVSVTLTPEQYELALKAHQDQVRLSIRGEVELRQRGASIDVAEYVQVEAAPVLRGSQAHDETSATLFD